MCSDAAKHEANAGGAEALQSFFDAPDNPGNVLRYGEVMGRPTERVLELI